jgi:hypothetical protein
VKKRVSCKSASMKRKNLCVIFVVCNSVKLLYEYLSVLIPLPEDDWYMCNSEL